MKNNNKKTLVFYIAEKTQFSIKIRSTVFERKSQKRNLFSDEGEKRNLNQRNRVKEKE